MCRILLAVTFLLASAVGLPPQQEPTSKADAANLTALTTPVEAEFSGGDTSSGSGFFYFKYGPDDPNAKGPHWRAITRMFLVTAKHVVQPQRIDALVRVRFAVRQGGSDGIQWYPIDIPGKELGKRIHVSPKREVDVAVIEITDLLKDTMKRAVEKRADILGFNAANGEEVPGSSPIEVQPGDDVIVIGYPAGLSDQYNKLPILKTGLLNTPVGFRFNGLDAFLIDFKYYEGMSGALIITKPTHFTFSKDKGLQFSEDRKYLFLGVYQGEYYGTGTEQLQRADLGLGWYYYNIDAAINNTAAK